MVQDRAKLEIYKFWEITISRPTNNVESKQRIWITPTLEPRIFTNYPEENGHHLETAPTG